MNKDVFTAKLRAIHKAGREHQIAFPDVDDFINYWSEQVTQQSEGDWSYEKAEEIVRVVITSR